MKRSITRPSASISDSLADTTARLANFLSRASLFLNQVPPIRNPKNLLSVLAILAHQPKRPLDRLPHTRPALFRPLGPIFLGRRKRQSYQVRDPGQPASAHFQPERCSL